MWKIIFWLWFIIFLTWLIPLINLPTWPIIKIIFWIEQLNQIISTQYMFTTIWAIFVFWYWYKKYERDKELEILEKFVLKKYKINSFEDIENIYPWISAVYSYQKWYISKDLFEIVDMENSDFLYYFLEEKLTFKSKTVEDYKKEVLQKTQEISKKMYMLNKYELFRVHILGILEKYSKEIKDKELSENIKTLLDNIKKVNENFNI